MVYCLGPPLPMSGLFLSHFSVKNTVWPQKPDSLTMQLSLRPNWSSYQGFAIFTSIETTLSCHKM